VRARGAGLVAIAIAAMGATACSREEPRVPAASPSAIAPAPTASAATTGTASAATTPAPSAAAAETAAEQKAAAEVRAMLARVARARGLDAKRPVKSRVLDRDTILARIRAHVDREVPKDVLELQGETLAALELVPPEYDFVSGMYGLIGGRIAGFYEPEDGTMYLVDDLGEEEAAETLAHELVHALQDQHYGLGGLLKYVPGDSDRLAAVHSLAEGDATSAMLDVTIGSAFQVSEGVLRRMFSMSTAFSSVGAKTPRVLQSSLTAPYTDGFAMVQDLRRRSSWTAVDADGWRALPQSTEQLLHPDKLATREAPLPVAPPTAKALGDEFRVALDDVLGEQGLRITFEEWTTREAAAEAAAGWGGDRYVVATRDVKWGREIAVGMRIVMDTAKDAKEAAKVFEARFGKTCKARPGLGPITWRMKGNAIAVVAGPYRRESGVPKGAGDCATAGRWLGEIEKGR
jgi:hypothetical protein